MANTVQSTQSAAQTAPQAAVPEERAKFLHKLLINPNYFGNLGDSPFKPVQQIKSNTTYEELKCVGFNPELSQLEGVVWIKQPGGYDGGICTSGSQEYVSFFLSYDNGATWLPQGTVHFAVYDVTGPHPLEYAVRLPIQPKREICFLANLPLVRAILSWNAAPTGPNATPVWGNVIESRIQIPGFFLEIPLPVLLDEAKLKLPADVAAIIAPDAAIKLGAPKALSAAELLTLYANAKVPTHRSLSKHIHSALEESGQSRDFEPISHWPQNRHQRRRRRAGRDQWKHGLRTARVHRVGGRGWGPRRPHWHAADQTSDRLPRRSVLCRKPRICGVLDRLGRRLAICRHSVDGCA